MEKKSPFLLKSFKEQLSEENQASVRKLVEDSQAIVLDIEGTITALDFVRKELFPYARSHLDDYIMKNWNDPEVKEAFAELQEQASIDEKLNLPGFVPIVNGSSDPEDSDEFQYYLKSIIANLKWQMDNDRKTTGLKRIQGLIWKIGYEKKLITGHLYDDVIPALKLWKSQGKDMYIYSSGSKEAQIYLLKYSKFGDLTKYFRDYFDTTIGSKLETNSYREICIVTRKTPKDIVFFTDRPAEISAAIETGMKTILVVRDTDHPLIKEENHLVGMEDAQITSFSDLLE